MGDQSDFHKAALKATKRGVIVAVWGLVVAVLGLGYTIFVDLGGVEWASGAVAEWLEDEPDQAEAGEGDAVADTATEEAVTESDAESDGSQDDVVETSNGSGWQSVDAFMRDWLVKPGLSFWTGFWHLGLIGLACTAVFCGLNALLRKLFKLDLSLVVCWALETLALAGLLVTAALSIGEGFWHTTLAMIVAFVFILLGGLVGFVVVVVLTPTPPPRTAVG